VPHYRIDASVFIEGGPAFGMIYGRIELPRPAAVGQTLPGLNIEELVVEDLIEQNDKDTMLMLTDVVIRTADSARELFRKCEKLGLYADEWNAEGKATWDSIP
jgi:hypothetical protein